MVRWFLGAGLRRLDRASQLLATPIETVRAARSPDLLRAHSRAAARLGRFVGLVVAAATVTVVVAAISPVTGAAVLATGAAIAAWGRFRLRSGRGRSQGWPPGSLSALPRPFVDRDHYFSQWREHGPVFKTAWGAHPVVCVIGPRAGIEVLRGHGDCVGPTDIAYNQIVPSGFIRGLGGAAHQERRRTVGAAFAHPLVERTRPQLVAGVARGLRRMRDAAESAGGSGVAPRPLLIELVADTWATVFFGLPPEPGLLRELRTQAAVLDCAQRRSATSAERLAAFEAIGRLVVAHGAGSGAGPALDTGYSVLGRVLDEDPDAVEDGGLVADLIVLMAVSSLDTSGLLAWMLKHLTDHGEWVSALRDDQAAGPGVASSLADRIVSETVRLEQVEYLHRVVTTEFEYAGYTFPEGWLLRVCLHEGHRDPVVFERPDEFDPDRFLGRRYSREEYAPFGLDQRSCVGEQLARALAATFVSELAQGYDWHATDDGRRELSAYNHWAPSSNFRVHLAARADSLAPAVPN